MPTINRFNTMLKRLQQNDSIRRTLGVALLLSIAALPAAADPPWVTASDKLMEAFTGSIAKSLSLVSIVIGGLMFAFGEGGSKRMLSGIIFGVGMAVSAVNFLSWLFN